jgi:nicotinate dehydrogenase subunit A
VRFTLHVNGQPRQVDVAPNTTLLSVLREDLKLTGTRFGCGFGMCGACYVLSEGQATPACTLAAADAAGKRIVTVEGLSVLGELTPVQRAFVECDAMQCGYCTSGMLISATALLQRNPHPSEGEIREALEPHLCRCGIYGRAVRAVTRAAG